MVSHRFRIPEGTSSIPDQVACFFFSLKFLTSLAGPNYGSYVAMNNWQSCAFFVWFGNNCTPNRLYCTRSARAITSLLLVQLFPSHTQKHECDYSYLLLIFENNFWVISYLLKVIWSCVVKVVPTVCVRRRCLIEGAIAWVASMSHQPVGRVKVGMMYNDFVSWVGGQGWAGGPGLQATGIPIECLLFCTKFHLSGWIHNNYRGTCGKSTTIIM